MGKASKIFVLFTGVLFAILLIIPFSMVIDGIFTREWQEIKLPNDGGRIKMPDTLKIVYDDNKIFVYEDSTFSKLIMSGDYKTPIEESGKVKEELSGLTFYTSHGDSGYSNSSFHSVLAYIEKESEAEYLVQYISIPGGSGYGRYAFYSEPDSLDSDTARRIAQSYLRR